MKRFSLTWNKTVKNLSWSYQGEPETDRAKRENFRGGEPPISDNEDLGRLPVKVALGVFATKDANKKISLLILKVTPALRTRRHLLRQL